MNGATHRLRPIWPNSKQIGLTGEIEDQMAASSEAEVDHEVEGGDTPQDLEVQDRLPSKITAQSPVQQLKTKS